MKIFNKLTGGFFVIAFIILLSSALGVWSISRVNRSLRYATTKTWIAANAAMQISIDNLTRIMALEEYRRGSRDQAKYWLAKSEESLKQNFTLLRRTGLAAEGLINNITELYDKLDKLQKRSNLIFSQRNKAKLQLDENAIIWTRTIEKLKYRIDALKASNPGAHGIVTGKMIDISILSLSERAAINNFLSGFLSENDYITIAEAFKNGIARRIDELSGITEIASDLAPLATVHRESDLLLETLFNQHRLYKTVQTDLSFNTLRLVEALENIKDMMNTKMSEAARDGYLIARTSTVSFMVFTVVGFLAALGIGILISTVITKPIISPTNASERIARGDLDERVAITARDEIGQLGEAFNRMASEIKTATQEIRDKNAELEQGNRKLSRANSELHTALEELQAKTGKLNALNVELQNASRLKSEFLANMSHELKTPLNAIIGFTKLVLKHGSGSLREEQQNNLRNVLISAEQLLKLINDILDLSKIEAGKMQLFVAPFDLHETVEMAAAMIRQSAEEKDLTVTCNVAEDLHKVYSDQDKVRQILINLLGNSVKFTSSGRIAVTARKSTMQKEGRGSVDCAAISVEDTGIGIAPKDRTVIFENFMQADGSITRRFGGSGLGLSISKKFARIIGGDITVESTPGAGSVFTLVFPIDIPPEEAAEAEDSLRRASLSAQGFRTTVLAIDDNQEFLTMMEKLLKNEGFQLVQAHNGYEGLAQAKALLPDIITIDILLPKKSGWDIIGELQADPRTKNIPVIIISIVDKKELSTRSGFSEYLQKPVRRDVLLKTLTKYIPQSKRVLIVDDDETICEKISEELSHEGLRVLIAPNGATGLELLDRYKPQMVLLEIQTPESDGYAFLAGLKTRAALADTPVIVFTAKELQPDERSKLERLVMKIVRKDATSIRNISGELLVTLRSLSR